jgi:hypothetical protein
MSSLLWALQQVEELVHREPRIGDDSAQRSSPNALLVGDDDGCTGGFVGMDERAVTTLAASRVLGKSSAF